jgi:hypothetical protein
VQDVENQILARKSEVEKLIQDMKSANLESLTISPPEETKAFLDGKSQLIQGFNLYILLKFIQLSLRFNNLSFSIKQLL